jgi:hypothetical protein
LIPTAADVVYANSRSIYIDTDITVQSLSNATIAGVTQGGIYYINNGVNINLTSNPAMFHTGPVVYAATNTPLVIISGSNSATITASLAATTYGPKIHLQDNSSLHISGSVVSTTNTANIGIRHSSTGNLTITGSLTPGGGQSAHVLYVDSSGSLNVSGSVVGSGTAIGIYNLSSGIVRIVGNVNGPTGTNGAVSIYNLLTGTIIVTGSVFGGDANFNGKWGIYNAGAGSIYISGSVFAGQGGQQANGVANASVGLVEIIGTVTGGVPGGSGALASMGGAQNNGAGTLIVRGTVSASIISPGVGAAGTTSTNIFTGPFYNTGSFNAVYAYRMQMIEPSSTSWRFDTEVAGGSKTLYTSNQLPGVPRQNNVRKGTQYNFGLTGSLEMPDPTTVKSGVTVDNTTGSAILTAQDMFDVLTQDITQTGSIGETLKNASTVQTVGATISSFKV